MASVKQIGLRKDSAGPLPHLVISFGDEDAGNLTYRALRHMMQLQIPLKVTVLIGEQYAHDTSTIRMMALGRRNTTILEHPYNFAEVYATADIILCASGYMPYEVAVMGIPCVVLAQNDFEARTRFSERTAWVHPSWPWSKSETIELAKRHHGTPLARTATQKSDCTTNRTWTRRWKRCCMRSDTLLP